jgi:hypothetical protein
MTRTLAIPVAVVLAPLDVSAEDAANVEPTKTGVFAVGQDGDDPSTGLQTLPFEVQVARSIPCAACWMAGAASSSMGKSANV